MKKAVIVKATLCIGTTAILLCGAGIQKTTSATLATETGMAGISLVLDKYYAQALNQPASRSVMPASAMDMGDQDPVSSQAPVSTEAPAADPTPLPTEAPTPEPVSEFANTGISVAANYVNIRSEANTESEVLGKLYKGSAATILETDGEWVKIKSGSVKGYIKSEFLAIGFDAEDLVDRYGTKWAEVTTTTLFVRAERSTESAILTMIPLGEEYEVLEEYDGWVKVLVDEGNEGEESTEGYVSSDYVNIRVEFKQAISVEEEQAEIRRAEEARKAEEEQARKLKEAQDAKRKEEQKKQAASGNNSSKNNSSSNNNAPKKESNNQPVQSGSGSGSEIAAYAQKFVGNSYVYGGTSLTNGADCSGFVQSVFKSFNISLPRTSASQSGSGTKASFDSLQAGDLIFYASNGRVNHVAIYIGGGKVVHASNRKTGIKISNMNYRSPYTARRVVK